MFICIAMLAAGMLLAIAPRLLPGFADRYAEVMNPVILNTSSTAGWAPTIVMPRFFAIDL